MSNVLCPVCGAVVAPAQPFCNRCGAQLRAQVVVVNAAPAGFAQRHLFLTIVAVVVVVACILPACLVMGTAAMGDTINAEFDRISATVFYEGTPAP